MSVRSARPRCEGGDVVLRVSGEVDCASVGELRRAIVDALGTPGGPVVLDFACSTFIDAAGLGTLVWFAGRAADAGRGCVLRNVSPWMQELLDLTGVQRRFDPGLVPA